MRTTQDNNILLYSLDELKCMQRRYKSDSKRWEPFTNDEIESEIIKREIEPTLIAQADSYIKMGYSEQYIQSAMYAKRNPTTGILHIAEAIKQAKNKQSNN